jgi:hypothetical protein
MASLAAIAVLLSCLRAQAQVVVAEPVGPVEPPFPEGAPPAEVQVVLQLVIDSQGHVESAVETFRAPADAPDSFAAAALEAAKATNFRPSTRDGRPLRSRIEYAVVFHPPSRRVPPSSNVSATATASRPLSTSEQDEDYAQVVHVRGLGWSSPRGLGDIRMRRELLEASPRQQTSEMLSAAPGFFVDHEEGEGLGNDVFLRGFDLDHGSGIEMRLGSIPINIPTHIQGQGYADANFIIPEVVRSIRVVEGPYDPRQGDAAIVGSAYFDLGLAERGYQLTSTYGSFHQWRVVGTAAPDGADEETFAAFSLRHSDGFGEDREAQSGSVNAQYGVDVGTRDHVRLIATAYGARSSLPGVVRRDDIDAGRIDYYGAYTYFAQGQGVQASRVIVGADFDHVAPSGARFEFAPWLSWTDFRARRNFTGSLETSQIDPSLSGRGDLFELTDVESAAGLTTRFHAAPVRIGSAVEVAGEPGVTARVGHTDQTKSILDPSTLQPWDRRIDAGLNTLDAGAYVDLDVRILRRLRVSGGLRADLLSLSIRDRLGPPPGSLRDVLGVAAGPRVTIAYELTPGITSVVSYGEGFRSLDASTLKEGDSQPYSKVRSIEAGVRVQTAKERYTTTVAVFATWVGNELVFEPAAGGLETEHASLRRGVVGSVVAKPVDWLLASTALSVTSATFSTLVAGIGHYVPSVPSVLFRADVTARGALARVRGKALAGRAGLGYTLLGGRHVTDTLVGPLNNVLNASAGLRYGWIEVGVDAYNVLGLQYPDDEQLYVSNWSLRPGQQPPSEARHITAAPPRTVLGTVSLYF